MGTEAVPASTGKSLVPLNCAATEEENWPQLDASKKAASESRGPPAKGKKGVDDTEEEDSGKEIVDNCRDGSQLVVSLPRRVDFDGQSSW